MSRKNRIKDCIKTSFDGMGKAVPPRQTYRTARTSIERMECPILKTYHKVQRPSGIPQFRFIGSEYFKQMTGMRGTNGKGHTPDQAKASGIMEMVERYSCYKYLQNRAALKLASFREMSRKRNPFGLASLLSGFVDGSHESAPENGDFYDIPIRWYPAYTLGGESLYLPAALSKYILHGSNGMAAGNSLEEALLQAVCEILERHCTTLIFTKKAALPLIDISTIEDPVCVRLIRKFRKLGHSIWIKDFSLDLGIPVMGVVRVISKTDCYITAGVASTREEALLRALTENSQAEIPLQRRFIHDLEHLFAPSRTLSFKDIPDFENKNIRVELENIEKILQAHGMDLFFLETTDRELGIPSVLAFVSGAKHFQENMVSRNFYFAAIEDFLETQRLADSFLVMDKFQKTDKNNTSVYEYYRGLIFLCLNNIESAAACFRKAAFDLSGHELMEMAFFLLGLCHQAQGQPKKAAYWYLKAMKHNPDYHTETSRHYIAAMQCGNDKLRTLFLEAGVLYDEVWRKTFGGMTSFYVGPKLSPVFVQEEEALDLIKISGQYSSVLRKLEARKAFVEAAQRAGLKATAQDLWEADEVSRRINGLRKTEDYYRWLGRQGISKATWEDYLKMNILIEKFMAKTRTSADRETVRPA